MKKKIATLMIAMLVLFPKTSRADLDVLSIVQDAIKVFQEKAHTVIDGYVGIQVHLQELTLNRDILNTLRDNIKGQLKEQANKLIDSAKEAALEGAKEFLNHQLSSVTLPGLNNSISFGPYTSPDLKKKVAKSYIKRKRKKNDVLVNIEQDKRNNKMMVENLAVIYSNALVKRKLLIQEALGDGDKDNKGAEEDEEDDKNTDVNTIQLRYGKVARRANHRWLEILRFEAMYRKALGEMYLTQGRVDDISEIVGTEESQIDTEGLEDMEEEIIKGHTSVDVLAMKDQFDSGLEAMKRGDYAGALNAASNAYGIGAVEGNQNIVNIVKTGAAGAGNAYNAAARGNWGGAVGSVGGAVGNTLGGDAGDIINTTTSGGGAVINNAMDGNWSNVVSGVGSTVGNSMGGVAGNEIDAWGGIIGSGMSIVGNSNNLEDIASGIADNRQLTNSIDKLNREYERLEAERQEAERKNNEELAAKLKADAEKIKKELNKKQCQECRSKNSDAACMTVCSF